jgi:hypothetical protein
MNENALLTHERTGVAQRVFGDDLCGIHFEERTSHQGTRAIN